MQAGGVCTLSRLGAVGVGGGVGSLVWAQRLYTQLAVCSSRITWNCVCVPGKVQGRGGCADSPLGRGGGEFRGEGHSSYTIVCPGRGLTLAHLWLVRLCPKMEESVLYVQKGV